MSQLHKVFLSFHSQDIQYKIRFEQLFHQLHGVVISRSVAIGDIAGNLLTETVRQKIRDEYLRDSSVTIVLVGSQTWQRKHVDWEIASSIRHTEFNPRSGLIGIMLPTHKNFNSSSYDPHSVPPRLHDNIKCAYSVMYDWTENPHYIQEWVHKAWLRKKNVLPDNSYPIFTNNRSGERWY